MSYPSVLTYVLGAQKLSSLAKMKHDKAMVSIKMILTILVGMVLLI